VLTSVERHLHFEDDVLIDFALVTSRLTANSSCIGDQTRPKRVASSDFPTRTAPEDFILMPRSPRPGQNARFQTEQLTKS
jgi:hypothetical protein